MSGASHSLSFATVAAVAAGGLVGAWLRYGLLRLAHAPAAGARPRFDPRIATLAANLLACVLLGALLSLEVAPNGTDDVASLGRQAFGITGVCGSLSTFSTLCADAAGPRRRSRSRSTVLVVVAHLVGGPLGLQLGLVLGRHLGG